MDIFIHNPKNFRQHLILVDIATLMQIKNQLVTNSLITVFLGGKSIEILLSFDA